MIEIQNNKIRLNKVNHQDSDSIINKDKNTINIFKNYTYNELRLSM